ncbi:hypothetical protein MSG28_002710 [Choristoneura fumiferana]|uniref:Uncharacterized protein n=1 Tax=Choristoneura fumiferana TaxID=7141 RepID=A0ACC0JIX6_CHOFU|nr:hypothetical protein MSG28_002710 [Choristoneura fumiferana]
MFVIVQSAAEKGYPPVMVILKMKIEQFSKFVSDTALDHLVLHDSVIVVAGTNFFSRSYQQSGLTHRLGCESHQYANYLRKYLAMFKKAGIQCFFLFDGCQKNKEETRDKESHANPIFMRNIYMEVLDEMEFKYVVCEYESKRDVIALGQKLDCPIISDDIEFCFSGCMYIPSPELKFNDERNTIECRYFLLQKFLHRHHLTPDQLAIFIVLTDSELFPAGQFTKFFQHIRAPVNNHYKRNTRIIQWLAQHTQQQAWKTIESCTTKDDYNNFSAVLSKVRLMVGRREAGGVGAAWLQLHGAPSAAGTGNWFPAGVAAKHVSIDYINLYRTKQFHGSALVKPQECKDDAMYISLDIAKYAFDLLTDFQNDGFVFVSETQSGRETMDITDNEHSIRKPNYEANVCVFENGWSTVRQLGLLDHFLQETLQRSPRALGWVPRGARLVLAALAYWTRRAARPAALQAAGLHAAADAAAVLLGYVALSMLVQRTDKNKKNPPKSALFRKPILSPSTMQDEVTEDDCEIAAALMKDYFKISEEEIGRIYNEDLIYPLVQFQHCLSQLIDLNALCGAPLEPPALPRAFSAPLVYKLRHAMVGRNPRKFVNSLLCPAPTVLAFANGLIDVYETLVL